MVSASIAARSGRVTLVGQGGRLVLLLLNLVILGRLIDPADFGLFAMLVAIVGVAELLRDLGLTAGAIQADQLSQGQKSNLFWANATLGLFLFGFFCGMAPLVATMYGEPRLTLPMMILSLAFVFNGFQAQFQAELARTHRFGTLAATDVGSQAFGLLVGIGFALSDFGYWSLVLMQVSAAAVCLIARVSVAHWRPSWVHRNESIRSVASFGWKLSLAQVLGYAANNAAVVGLGWNGFTSGAGYYSRSNQILSVPINQIFGPLTNVALASLSREADAARFARVIRRLMVAVGTTGAVVFATTFALAPGGVTIVLGPDWDGAVMPTQILSLGMIFQTLTFPYYWALLARGMLTTLLVYNIATKGLTIGLVIAGSSLGAVGAAAGYSVGLALAWPACVFAARHSVAVSPLRLASVGLLPLAFTALSALVSTALARWMAPSGDLEKLLVGLAALAFAAGLTLALPRARRDLSSTFALLKRRKGSR